MTSLDRLLVLFGLPAALPYVVIMFVWGLKLQALSALPYKQRPAHAGRLERSYGRLLTGAATLFFLVMFVLLMIDLGAPYGAELICVVPLCVLAYVIFLATTRRILDWATTRQLDLWHDQFHGEPFEP